MLTSLSQFQIDFFLVLIVVASCVVLFRQRRLAIEKSLWPRDIQTGQRFTKSFSYCCDAAHTLYRCLSFNRKLTFMDASRRRWISNKSKNENGSFIFILFLFGVCAHNGMDCFRIVVHNGAASLCCGLLSDLITGSFSLPHFRTLSSSHSYFYSSGLLL